VLRFSSKLQAIITIIIKYFTYSTENEQEWRVLRRRRPSATNKVKAVIVTVMRTTISPRHMSALQAPSLHAAAGGWGREFTGGKKMTP
jgi:hypothetical protein